MNDEQLPEWVRKQKAANETKCLREEVDRQTAIAGSLRIQHEGPQIVGDLLRELLMQVEAARELGFSGGVTPKSEPDSDYVGQVNVILPGNYPRFTHTAIHYNNGDNEIRFLTLEGKAFKLLFMVHKDGVRLYRENSVTPMTSRDAAEWLVERMCASVSKRY